MDCVQELAREMIDLIKQGKSASEIAEIYRSEDADLVGEALVEAQSLMSGE